MNKKDEKIVLSYSTLSDLKKWRHSWLNKMMKLPKKEFKFLQEGRDVQDVLLPHMAGVKLDKRITKREKADSRFKLPPLELYEKIKFDPDVEGRFDVNYKYSFVVYTDGLNLTEKFRVEVKSSSSTWTLGMVRNLVQRKIQAIAFPETNRSYLVSAARNLKLPGWELSIKSLPAKDTEEEKEEAWKWIMEGVKILEKGDFEPDKEELEFIESPYNKCWYEGCKWCG